MGRDSVGERWMVCGERWVMVERWMWTFSARVGQKSACWTRPRGPVHQKALYGGEISIDLSGPRGIAYEVIGVGSRSLKLGRAFSLV